MNVELVDFKATDGVLLNGFIKKNGSNKIVISTHGMGSDCFKIRDRKIAEEISKLGIDYFFYNNRGNCLTKTVAKELNGKQEKIIAGTTFEDVEDGYFDVKGAILKAIQLGYTDIYLQGHSLGSTKTVYTYNKLKDEQDDALKYIKGIILLSLVDIPRALEVYLKGDFEKYLNLAENKEKENKLYDIMPKECFIQPVCVKTYLKYVKYNTNFNFARYNDKNYNFDILNKIEVPLFMRWGNVYEMIEQEANDLSKMMNEKIKNPNKDISFIDGATHSYEGKEQVLANQISNFLKIY